MKYISTLFLVVFYLGNLFSQFVDTTNHLQIFEKISSGFIINTEFLKTTKDLIINEERSNESLDQILQGETINYLKTYGPGSLSSISTRGGNAQQTSLIYNDFVINNPLNGAVDLSTIPSVFFNSINVLYGLSSSNQSNGGLAGSILLNDNPSNKNFVELGSIYGSYEQNTNYLKLNYSKKKITTSFNLFRKSALNNFKYLDLNNNEKKQENSSFNHLAIMSKSIILLPKSVFKVIYFGQIIKRRIPSGILESTSNAFQEDINNRVFLTFKHRFINSYIQLKSAYYNEENIYTDSIRSIFGNNPCKTFINQIDFSKSINDFNLLKFNLTNSLANSNGNNFNETAKINRTSFTSSFKINNPDFKLKHILTTSILFDNNNLSPITFTYSLKREFLNQFNVYLNTGKVYRFPTINDLYWNPGGNENLLPENGYTSDLGLVFTKKVNKATLTFEPSLYSRWIDNWILWQPNGDFWSPMNVKKVWNRGIETSSKFNISNKKLDYQFTIKTAYNMSTNVEVENSNNNSLNKQLIYTPHYKLVFKSQLKFKDLSITYIHNYIGYRFTSRDNENYLPSFNLGRLFVSYRFQLKNNSTKIFYKINNLYNTNYQLVMNRAMPLMNHEIGINFKINK